MADQLPEIGAKLIAEAVDQYLADMKKAEKANTDFVDNLGKGAKESEGFGEIMTGALRHIGEIAVDSLMKAGQAVIGFAKSSIDVASSFQDGMNQFASVAGDAIEESGKDLKGFQNLFLDIGKRLPVSTAEVQQAAINMVKGGIEPAILAAGGLEDNIQFASAAGMKLADAADLSAKQLGIWTDVTATAADKVQFLAMSHDLLVKAANASTVDVDKLAKAMNIAGGQARTAGVDYKDFTILLAQTSKGFNSAEEAGNAYKNFLARLQPSAQPAKDAMADLGLMTTNTTKLMEFLSSHGIKPLGTDLGTLQKQFYQFADSQDLTKKETAKLWDTFQQSKFFDLSGKFIGNRESAELLKQSLAGLSDAERVAALQTIFGNDAMGTAALLAREGAEGYDAMAASMDKQSGVAGTAAAKQQGFSTALENFNGSIEALKINIGLFLLPLLEQLFNQVLSPAVNFVTSLVDGTATFDQALQNLGKSADELIPGMSGVLGVVVDLLKPFGTLGEYLLAVVEDGDTLNDFFKELPAPLQLIGQILGEQIVFWQDLVESLLGIGKPAAIMTQTFDSMAGTMTTVTTGVSGLWGQTDTLTESISKLITDGVQFLAHVWTDELLPAITIVSNYYRTEIMPVIGDVMKVVIALVEMGIKVLAAAWENVLVPALKIVWQIFTEAIMPTLKDVFHWLGENLPPAIQKVSDFLTETFFPAVGKVFAFLQENVVPILIKVGQIFTETILVVLKGTALFITQVLVPAFNDVWKFLSVNLGPILKDFGEWLGKVTGGWEGITRAVKDLIHWLDGIIDSIKKIGDTMPSWLIPGSPTPFEIGLRGIASAADVVSNSLDVLPDIFQYLDAGSGDALNSLEKALDLAKKFMDEAGDQLLGAQISIPRQEIDNMEMLANLSQKVADAQKDVATSQQSIVDISQALYDLQVERNKASATEKATIDLKIAALGKQKKAEQEALKAAQDRQKELEDVQTRAADATDKLLEQVSAREQTNPEQAQEYYALRSGQIKQLADLETKIAEATDQKTRERLTKERELLLRSQAAEEQLFDRKAQRQIDEQKDKILELHDALQEVLNNITTTDPNGPAPAVQALFDLVTQLMNVQIPDWLEGHSPPPLADWLASIGDAATAATAGLAGLGRTVSMPSTTVNNYQTSSPSSYTYAPQYNYAPQYGSSPKNPSVDFRMMRAIGL